MLGWDFHNFWDIGTAVLKGIDPYSIPYSFYPPITNYLFVLFALIPFNFAFPIWTGANVVMLISSLSKLSSSRRIFLWIAFTPVVFVLLTGQIDIFFFWVAGFLAATGWGSPIAGAVLTLKPQLAFIALPWIIIRWLKQDRVQIIRWISISLVLHTVPLVIHQDIYANWFAAAQGEVAWRLLASPGLFSLLNLNVPIWLLSLLNTILIIWGLFSNAYFSRICQTLALPGGLWYNDIFLISSSSVVQMVIISWIAFIAAALFTSPVPFLLIPASAFINLVLGRRKSLAGFHLSGVSEDPGK